MGVVNTDLRSPGRIRASKEPRVRSTITFTGAAGAGAIGIVTVFTITGRIWLKHLSVFCTASLTESAPTSDISLGTASVANNLITSATGGVTAIDAGLFWAGATPLALIQETALTVDVLVSENIILTVSGADVTGGVLIIDAWYEPISDNGRLS